MKLTIYFLLMSFVIFFQGGCSVKKTTQPVQNIEQREAKKESNGTATETHYILGGMTREQGENLAKAIQKAHAENEPILKGMKLEEQKKWDEAIKHYEAMLMTGKFDLDAHAGLARVYEAAGDYDKAAQHLQEQINRTADWAKPDYDKKLAELKAKASHQ